MGVGVTVAVQGNVVIEGVIVWLPWFFMGVADAAGTVAEVVPNVAVSVTSGTVVTGGFTCNTRISRPVARA